MCNEMVSSFGVRAMIGDLIPIESMDFILLTLEFSRAKVNLRCFERLSFDFWILGLKSFIVLSESDLDFSSLMLTLSRIMCVYAIGTVNMT